MESVHDIKEALSARSRTATLDELRNEGKKRVRLIRAEHVAAMVAEAVNSAVEQSGLLKPDEVERLVEKSRLEFRSILKEREQEVQRAQEMEQTLAERDEELTELRGRFEQVANALAETRQQLAALEAAGRAAPAAAAPAGGMSADMLMLMMNEMATMKASLMQQQQPQAQAPQGGAGVDLSAALDKLTGSLNDRLEKLGRKMGISSAVESDQPMNFNGLFRDADQAIESNMDNIQVKQKAGGGIAANLAKLKKLKGGG